MRNRSSTRDQYDAGPIAKRIAQRNVAITFNDDIVSELEVFESGSQRALLVWAAYSGNSRNQNPRSDILGAGFSERLSHESADDGGRFISPAGGCARTSADRFRELPTGFVGDNDTRFRSAAIDSNEKISHSDLPRADRA